jgi:hypothetical protein
MSPSQRSGWAHRLEQSEIHGDDEFFAILYTVVSIQIREHWGGRWRFDVAEDWDHLVWSVTRRLSSLMGGTEADLHDPAVRRKFETCLFVAGQMLLGRGLVDYGD